MKGLRCGGSMYIVLIYDIKQKDEYAKAARRVFKICKKYLVHIQNSVFEGELSVSQIYNLKCELKEYLREEIDSCIIFTARNNIWMKKEFLTNNNIEPCQFI